MRLSDLVPYINRRRFFYSRFVGTRILEIHFGPLVVEVQTDGRTVAVQALGYEDRFALQGEDLCAQADHLLERISRMGE